MHTDPLVPCAPHDAPAAIQGIGAGPRTGYPNEPDRGDREVDATLRLLKSCVEAMGLLQAKVTDLDQRLGAQPDALAAVKADVAALREKVVGSDQQAGETDALATVRADVAALRDALAHAGQRVEDADARAGQVEISLIEHTKRHADDIAAARMEAAQWRMRVETDGMAFDQLSARLGCLEQGLTVKLDETKQALAEREAENAQLQAETRVVETSADRLRVRLTTMDATIADQRARIQCLQNKLATATYAMRVDHLARTMESGHAMAAFDILDLGVQSGSRVSAA